MDIIEIGKMSKSTLACISVFVVGGNFVAVEVKDKMAICDEQNRVTSTNRLLSHYRK